MKSDIYVLTITNAYVELNRGHKVLVLEFIDEDGKEVVQVIRFKARKDRFISSGKFLIRDLCYLALSKAPEELKAIDNNLPELVGKKLRVGIIETSTNKNIIATFFNMNKQTVREYKDNREFFYYPEWVKRYAGTILEPK